MTIVASGEISLGGNATATRSVACELGRSGTAAICMDESAVRKLAARTTAASAICMNDFYGKADTPAGLGCVYRGGYYTGIITSPANYYLIVAPNASGCACCQWKTTNTSTGNSSDSTCSRFNGYWNTFNYLNNADHPAGNWTATRSIGGFSDWYLPARCEISVLLTNSNCLPVDQRYNGSYHWTSTEYGATAACSFHMSLGTDFNHAKTTCFNLRAVRRVSTCF